MPNDGEWFRFETSNKRAVRIPVLPEIATELVKRARAQGVSIETLVNIFLMERIWKAILIPTSSYILHGNAKRFG